MVEIHEYVFTLKTHFTGAIEILVNSRNTSFSHYLNFVSLSEREVFFSCFMTDKKNWQKVIRSFSQSEKDLDCGIA